MSDDGDGANSGPLDVASNGAYAKNIPLFCGKQHLELLFGNAAGTSVRTFGIDRQGCETGGLRFTLTWGAGANDLEAHLIIEGGRINNPDGGTGDCTWTSCLPGLTPLPWGTQFGAAGAPQKDVDWMEDRGVENIYLTKPEPKKYHLYVEYWATGTPTTATATLNFFGKTQVLTHANFTSRQVWDVGVIDGAAKTFAPSDATIDCTADWSGGCRRPLPQ